MCRYRYNVSHTWQKMVGFFTFMLPTYYNGYYLIGNTEVMVQVVTNLHAIFCTFWVCLRMLDHLYYYSEERVRIAVSWLTGLPAVRLIQNQGNSAIAWSITMRDMTMMKVKSQRSTKFWITTRFSLLFCEKKLLKKSSIWSNLGSSKEENTGDQGWISSYWLGIWQGKGVKWNYYSSIWHSNVTLSLTCSSNRSGDNRRGGNHRCRTQTQTPVLRASWGVGGRTSMGTRCSTEGPIFLLPCRDYIQSRIDSVS